MESPSALQPLSAPSLPHDDMLDPLSEDAFDRITALAARLFDVSAAFIGLIENRRIWYQSPRGIDRDEVLRELSFSPRVLGANAPCWCEDLAIDPAWAGNPQTLGASKPWHFFAAAPLRSLEGEVLGSFCLVHGQPRRFSESDRQTLSDLAGIVADELELRRAARASQDTVTRAEEALRAQDRYLGAVVETQRQLLDGASVHECLPSILGVLGEASLACRAAYFDNGRDAAGRLYCELTHEWCAPGVDYLRGTAEGMRVYPDDFSPRWQKQLHQGKAVNVVATDPSLDDPERQYLAARHALSLMFAPVMVEGEFAGVLSFHCCKEPHRLGAGERNPLLTAASAIAQALEREGVAGQLLAEKEQLAVTLASITEAVITADLRGRTVLLNRVAEELTGWSSAEALGRPLTEVFAAYATGNSASSHAPLRDPLERVLETGRAVSRSRSLWLGSREGGERRRIAMSTTPVYDRDGKVIGAVRVFRDVSDQEKLIQETIKASKLESVGILAGGIAHDFNNILTAIIGNLSLGRLLIEQNKKTASLGKLDEAERACQRAKDLTGQLLTFSKGGAPVKRLARLPEIIRESVGFALHGGQVACEFFFEEAGLWPVEADVGQLSQVLSNLSINAVQAMPRGGAIKVRAENLFLAENAEAELPAGAYVRISIQDEGTGISPEHMLRIFDPFFSTKKHGSGLGLATSYSIIHKHGGRLTAESVPGSGTIFRIYLPAEHEAQHLEETPAAPPPPLPKGRGRILLLDDESAILDLAGSMLAYLGYEVTATSRGVEAVTAYRQTLAEGRPFSAAILDLTLPGGLDGREVVAALREMDPGVRAVVSSGYSNDPVMSDYLAHGFCGVLSKPYCMDDLAAVLDAVLGAGSSKGGQ